MIQRMLNTNQNMTQSESEEQVVNLEDNEDEMTFLRGGYYPQRKNSQSHVKVLLSFP